MNKTRSKTKHQKKTNDLADRLNRVSNTAEGQPANLVQTAATDADSSITTAMTAAAANADQEAKHHQLLEELDEKLNKQMENNRIYQEQVRQQHAILFDDWENKDYIVPDYKAEVPVDSLESSVGYSSLIRQLHASFTRTVAFYRSDSGGTLTPEQAREKAFHRCEDPAEAKKIFDDVMRYPLENISFDALHSLSGYAPRVAEQLWETIKNEGQAEFESGHLAANTMFPAEYMQQAWSIAKYLGLRESFIAEWNPQGGIELSLIDMLAQTFLQWQYWLAETVKRSQTRPREEHHEYQKWKQSNEKTKNSKSWQDGYWFPTYVDEQQEIENAVQMADRFNRIYMRTLRQLRDLRRYAPVTINNPNQVNIAADGGQQINVSKAEERDTTKVIS